MRHLAVLLICLAACASREDPARPTPLTDALLEVSRSWGTRDLEDSAFARGELDRIAERVRSAQLSAPEEPARVVLNRVVFEELGFAREVEQRALDFVLLPAVLHNRRGSCVGLGSLYLALGERLGWSVHGVLVPGHFFVRFEERGTVHNVELLRRGEELPDGWYSERYPIAGGSAPEYQRTLSAREVAGVIEFNVGNQRKNLARWSDAKLAYQRARQHFPDFAEAHASAGALAQLLGRLDHALEAYRAARRANPNLPGVDSNLALLEAELARGEARLAD
jgi:regulator of sirC expression with transglutaminase-like and TPR domain